MNTIITAKDFHLTQSIKNYVQEKSEKLMRVDSTILGIKYELDVDRHHQKGVRNRVEVYVERPGSDLRAGDIAETMREAIDAATKKIARQLSDTKERRRTQRRKATE